MSRNSNAATSNERSIVAILGNAHDLELFPVSGPGKPYLIATAGFVIAVGHEADAADGFVAEQSDVPADLMMTTPRNPPHSRSSILMSAIVGPSTVCHADSPVGRRFASGFDFRVDEIQPARQWRDATHDGEPESVFVCLLLHMGRQSLANTRRVSLIGNED